MVTPSLAPELAIVIGGAGLVVSQWNTALGWPYRAMQFKSTIKDTTTGRHGPVDPMNL